MLFAEQQVVAKFRESFSTLTIIPKVFSAASFLKFFFLFSLPFLSYSCLLTTSKRVVQQKIFRWNMISHLIQLQVVQRQWTPKWQILVNDLTIIQYLFRFHIIQPTFVGNKNILCALSLQILQFSIQKMAGIHIDVFSLSSNKLCKQER